MNNITTKRQMNIEVLRILSMLGIIMMHFLLASGAMKEEHIHTVNYHLALTVEAFCYGAVNVYVLISGYFSSKARLKIDKLLNIWIRVIGYTVPFYIFSVLIGMQDFSTMIFISRLMSISYGHYWFVSVWLVLYMISPILNFYISKISKKIFLRSLIILILIFSVWPIITNSDAIGVGQGFCLYWMITNYLIGGFIGKYKEDFKIKKVIYIGIYLVASFFSALGRVVLAHITNIIFGKPYGQVTFLSYNAPLILIASIAIFMFFVKSNVNNKLNKFIGFFASSTFGVYLIHMNLDLYPIIFKSVLQADKFVQSPFLVPYALICIIVVFVLCALLDKLRDIIFKKCKVYSFTKNIDEKIMSLIDKFENKYTIKSKFDKN